MRVRVEKWRVVEDAVTVTVESIFGSMRFDVWGADGLRRAAGELEAAAAQMRAAAERKEVAS